MTQDRLPASNEQPTMEILDGGETPVASGSSRLVKLARGAMYGLLLMGATALLAVSAVPELARYATFLPQRAGSSCSAAASGAGSHCTTLDQVSFDKSCCSSKTSAVSASTSEASGCCPLSAGTDKVSLLTSAESGTRSCCSSISRASLLAASLESAPCCQSEDGCVAQDATAAAEQPIDAGSLLAVTTTEKTSDEQADEQGTELKPDDNKVKK